VRGDAAVDDAEHSARNGRATREQKAQRLLDAQHPLAHSKVPLLAVPTALRLAHRVLSRAGSASRLRASEAAAPIGWAAHSRPLCSGRDHRDVPTRQMRSCLQVALSGTGQGAVRQSADGEGLLRNDARRGEAPNLQLWGITRRQRPCSPASP
jgi:hypothetical protein